MDNIYSAYHYSCKTKADKEAIEQIYEEVKKSAQNAIYRNIGDIFFTARIDTEINGAVECNGGTYSTADFEGKQTVGNLLASGSLPYVSLSEYESLVSANGSCRAFGWDGGTEFRVPTIKALLLNKEQAAVVGNGMALGLTDGTNINMLATNSNASGIYPSNTSSNSLNYSTNNVYSNFSGLRTIGIATDATKSGIVANLDVIEYRAMVQLANRATDQAVITATSALQQIANKVDKTSATDRETVVGWGMPDYSATVSLSTGTITKFPCYAIGYVRPTTQGSQSVNVKIDGIEVYNNITSGSYTNVTGAEFIIPKGSTLVLSGNKEVAYYAPLKGVN